MTTAAAAGATPSSSSLEFEYRTAELPSGVSLAYIDSWSSFDSDQPAPPPPPSPTTKTNTNTNTILALHGVGFNSAVWTPLIPHLSPSTRLLAYNQRSYLHSSPAFTESESDPQASTPTTTTTSVRATAEYLADLLGFMRFAVEQLGVKGVDDGTGEGGITLLCWSKASALALALLSLLHPSASSSPSPSAPNHSATSFSSYLPPSIFSDLDLLLPRYLRCIILFEPPGSALGLPPTVDYTRAMSLVSPSASDPLLFASAFKGWISSSSLASPARTSPPVIPPELLQRAWEPHTVAHGFSWRLCESSESSGPASASLLAQMALNPPGGTAISVAVLYGATTVGYCFHAARTIGEWWGVGPGVDLGSTITITKEGLGKLAGTSNGQGEGEGEGKGEDSAASLVSGGGDKERRKVEDDNKVARNEEEEEEEEGETVKLKRTIKRLEGPGSNHFAMVHQPREFVQALQGLWEELV